jgi:hypothetical protein
MGEVMLLPRGSDKSPATVTVRRTLRDIDSGVDHIAGKQWRPVIAAAVTGSMGGTTLRREFKRRGSVRNGGGVIEGCGGRIKGRARCC